MKRLLDLIAMSTGGWLGWMVGAWISTFAAYILSVVAMGSSLYAIRRLTKHLLP